MNACQCAALSAAESAQRAMQGLGGPAQRGEDAQAFWPRLGETGFALMAPSVTLPTRGPGRPRQGNKQTPHPANGEAGPA